MPASAHPSIACSQELSPAAVDKEGRYQPPVAVRMTGEPEDLRKRRYYMGAPCDLDKTRSTDVRKI